MPADTVREIIRLLIDAYGDRAWHSDHQPLATLIQTILSQNTSDTNSRRAFRALRKAFPRWEDLAEADMNDIAHAIRSGGLGEVKSIRIRQALQEIKQKRGNFDLSFLKESPVSKARDWLMELPGVGMKTANCVLLFSLGMPALPVDTHIFRVAKRLRLIDTRATIEQAHRQLADMVPPESVYQFHVLMIEHGRRTCKARRPLCPICILRGICPSYAMFTKSTDALQE